MYVGMRSVPLNYGNFRRPVEGAIKPSIAGFGCFQCIFSLAPLTNCNYPRKNFKYISDYIQCQSGRSDHCHRLDAD